MRTLLTLLLLSVLVRAADADNDLMMKVKAAIARDTSLRGVSVMVSVQDGVAVLGGAVPSAAVNDSLAQAVKAVPGITDVRVNCWVPAAEDPLKAAVMAKLKPESPARTTVLPANPLPLVAPLTGLNAAYSPVPPPAPPAPKGPPEFPTIPSPRVPMTPSQDVAEAVNAIRTSDVRFDGLTVSVNAGTVLIAGQVKDGADAWDLAAAIRRIPGVDKVIVGRTTPR